ncbi:MAG: DUF1285 domain-containing protein [Idiomarina sp.]|nr:DUF1285 domain-containing protein [Idiomarina sp.]
MVDIARLQDSLSDYKRPPLERWDPPFCGDIDIRINHNGEWLYQGSVISRAALVRLFASVLWRQDGEYFLITPAEKVRIQVDDLPFMITQWKRLDNGQIQVTTNTDEHYIVSAQYPCLIEQNLPAVKIRDGFLARVHRNVYYQWVVEAEPATHDEADGIYLSSGNERFWLGSTV